MVTKKVEPRYPRGVTEKVHTMSSALALRKFAKASHGRALVSFSGGKDSVGSVIALQDAGFTDLHLFHLYTVPGLRLVEEGLTYYERLWGRRITRLPHPMMYKLLKDSVFQSWINAAIIFEWSPEKFDYDFIAQQLKDDLGWSQDVPMAVGTRIVDSIFRRSALKKTGVFNAKRNVLYPIFDWTKNELADALIRTQTRLVPDYHLCGRSFDGNGLDYRFLEPLWRYYPDDFKRILEFFPNAHASLLRYQFAMVRRSAGNFSNDFVPIAPAMMQESR